MKNFPWREGEAFQIDLKTNHILKSFRNESMLRRMFQVELFARHFPEGIFSEHGNFSGEEGILFGNNFPWRNHPWRKGIFHGIDAGFPTII